MVAKLRCMGDELPAIFLQSQKWIRQLSQFARPRSTMVAKLRCMGDELPAIFLQFQKLIRSCRDLFDRTLLWPQNCVAWAMNCPQFFYSLTCGQNLYIGTVAPVPQSHNNA